MNPIHEHTILESVLDAITEFRSGALINVEDIRLVLAAGGTDLSGVTNNAIGRLMRLRCDPVGRCYCGHLYQRRW